MGDPSSTAPGGQGGNVVPLGPGEALQIGPFRLVARFIGEGKSDVFLAHKLTDLGFIRLAVFKLARRDQPSYEKRRQALYDEARAIAFLDHANLVSIIDAGESPEGTHLAIECVDGTDLEVVNARLRTRGEALPFELASFIAAEVLRGLHHAHTAVDAEGGLLRIIHRDVSPSNVLIAQTGHVKLTDFSVVHMNDRMQDATKPGTVKGAFAYLAPEYIEGEPVDQRVDIYAVGIMLFELLTGRRCFTGNSVYDVMRKIVGREIRFHRLEREGVPSELRRIVEKSTARQPSQRFNTAEDMANAIESWVIRSTKHVSPWILSAFFRQHKLFEPSDEEKLRAIRPPATSSSGIDAAALGAKAALSTPSLIGSERKPSPLGVPPDRAKTEVGPTPLSGRPSRGGETASGDVSFGEISTAPNLPQYDSEPPKPTAPAPSPRGPLAPIPAGSTPPRSGPLPPIPPGSTPPHSPIPQGSTPPAPGPLPVTPRATPGIENTSTPPAGAIPMASTAPRPPPFGAPNPPPPAATPPVQYSGPVLTPIPAPVKPIARPPPLASTVPQAGVPDPANQPNPPWAPELGTLPVPAPTAVHPNPHALATPVPRPAAAPQPAPDPDGGYTPRGPQMSQPPPSSPRSSPPPLPPPFRPSAPPPPPRRSSVPAGPRSSPPPASVPPQMTPSASEPVESPWRGLLGATSAADVVARLAHGKATGIVEFKFGLLWKKLSVVNGEAISVSSNSGMELIGEQLVDAKLITRQELDRALRESLSGNKTFIEKILELKLVERGKLEAHLGKNIAERLRAVFEWTEGEFEFVAQDQKAPAVLPSLDLASLVDRYRRENTL